MATAVNEIINGAAIRYIIASVTPGGGKSLLPVITGRLITAGLADALCWVVPRKTLQRQGEMVFLDQLFRDALDHNLTIRSSTNETNPCRGLNGFVTTYQALATDKNKTVQAAFSSKKYILILDEYHHAEENGIWHETLMQIERMAKYVVLMTGTLERGNGTKIAFTPYLEQGHRLTPNLQHTHNTRIIKYSRQDALDEKAIIPLTFFLSDGSAAWVDSNGKRVEHESISQVRKNAGAAIYTAISTEYADDLLHKGYTHWRSHKENIYPAAKMLVVTASIEHAKKAVKFFKNKFLNAEICTSHESNEALQAIKNFQDGKTDVLVGIAMFYEGFDCKQITHIIALTNIRSTPWLEQMLARAVRVDPDAGYYEMQCGYIFAPDDVLFRNVVERIKKEQAPFVEKRSTREQIPLFTDHPLGPNDGGGHGNIYNIEPLNSNLTKSRTLSINNGCGTNQSIALQPIQAPSEIEADLRDSIERHVRRYAFNNRYKPQIINAAIKANFRKSRDMMTIHDLEMVLIYIKKEYPLSQIRGTGRRVPYTVQRVYPELG